MILVSYDKNYIVELDSTISSIELFDNYITTHMALNRGTIILYASESSDDVRMMFDKLCECIENNEYIFEF